MTIRQGLLRIRTNYAYYGSHRHAVSSLNFKRKVIVTGGGVSGLTAATALIKNGNFDVTLLEADNRIGGRVHTVKLGDYYVESGAQWVHGEKNNSTFLKCQPLNLLDPTPKEEEGDSFFITQYGLKLTEPEQRRLEKYIEIVTGEGPNPTNSEPDQPFGIWAENIFWENHQKEPVHKDMKVCAAALDWVHRFQTGIDGSDHWYQPSCKGEMEYWHLEGNPVVTWKPPACYASLLNLLLHDKPSFAPNFVPEIPNWIQLNKEVVEIDYQSQDTVNVKCKDGSTFTCDHIICTVSLGVLKEKANSMFVPSLPVDKLNAIKHLSISCVDKLHFEFSNKWWAEGVLGFNFMWDELERVEDIFSPRDDGALGRDLEGFPVWCRAVIGFYPVETHPTALICWITGPAAKFIETRSDKEVQETLMRLLRKFLTSMYDEVPNPVNFVRSKWYTNPFTRGSYSFRSVNSEQQDVWSTQIATPILTNKGPVVCFAGEASHIHFYSTVHGAHDSGLREAQRLINFHNGNTEEISPLYPYTADMFEEQNNGN